ncbi:MAG: gamma-glutamyltransferase [Candidatus Tectomicrobia bacterium]|uniref:Glutathione hydrolase proenzyme n=1 Tax=Tectimicrobiota bacterium TaxID=2528274 RepID=A0A932GSE3_UNCTE|nr:gamma-glutamyltransferase [Candidatus Tectomicrobia bacterium]
MMFSKQGRTVWMLVLLSLLLFTPFAGTAAERSSAQSAHGMVASAHPLASRTGIEILKKGGNAVDAAVAMAFVLGVVEPHSSGIGGGGFMLIRSGRSGEITALDYREKAPARASRDMYLDKSGNVVPGLSTEGYRAAAVPGTVAGLTLALQKYGSKTLPQVLSPAIRYADQGFPVSAYLREQIKSQQEKLAKFPDSRRIFLHNGNPPQVGEILVQKELANTLKAVAQKGVRIFYEGSIADIIDREMRKNGGLMREDDLAAYRAVLRPPVRGTYRGYEIVSMPPPSSGGVHLIQILNILEGYDLHRMGRHSAAAVHLEVEAFRRAYADRAQFLGDPGFVKIPVAGLLSKPYATALRGKIDLDRATPSREVKPGNPAAYESPSTTHLSVVDREGNAVALTQTINTTFGSGVVIPSTGILLNNEMDDFSAKPGVSNVYGLVGSEANSIAPGKIPLSSMTPTMVFRGGKLFLVLGSPGGSRIITAAVQVILNVIDYGMNIRDAVSAPRIHHQWLPDEVQMEKGALPSRVLRALEAMGHTVRERDSMGNVQAILVDPATGAPSGVSDPRGVGVALAQ